MDTYEVHVHHEASMGRPAHTQKVSEHYGLNHARIAANNLSRQGYKTEIKNGSSLEGLRSDYNK
jgi:hypothetical protein